MEVYMIIEQSNKIKALRIINERKKIVKEISNYIEKITLDSFISIENTIDLSGNAYKYIDTIENKIMLDKENKGIVEKINCYKEKFEDISDAEGVLLHYYDRNVGALILTVKEFWHNIDNLLKFIKFYDGYRDLIFVEKNLKFGICIERFEYNNQLVIWK